jgi:hypothetical protein
VTARGLAAPILSKHISWFSKLFQTGVLPNPAFSMGWRPKIEKKSFFAVFFFSPRGGFVPNVDYIAKGEF